MPLRKPLTYEQWQNIATASISEALRKNPGSDPGHIMRTVNGRMVEVYGPCPPDPEPPLKLRVGLWGLRKKLSGLEPVEVSMFWKKLLVSVGAGVAAGAAAIQPALADSVVTGNEWGAVITAGVIAAYAAFKSNTTWISPARKGETITKFGTGDGDFVRPPR